MSGAEELAWMFGKAVKFSDTSIFEKWDVSQVGSMYGMLDDTPNLDMSGLPAKWKEKGAD